MSTRTLISLPDQDKAWLDAQAAQRGEPMTQLVREAVADYRVRASSRAAGSFSDLLDSTAGLFARRGRGREDGLRMQQRLRDEWSRGAPRAKR